MSALSKAPLSVAEVQNQIAPNLKDAVKVVDGSSPVADPARAVMVTNNEQPESLIARCLKEGIRHFCQISTGSFESELNTSALMVKDPQMFLNYPISSIIAPNQAGLAKENDLTAMNFVFNQASQKGDVLAHARAMLLHLQRSETLTADAIVLIDEMYTNAIFNAPFINTVTGHNPGVDRSDSSVKMGPGREAQIVIGYDEERLVIVCRDPFGSLRMVDFLSRILDCYTKGISGSIKMDSGGAGIGSFMVFNNCSSLYVGVESGKRTVVAATMQRQWSARRRSEAAKNLHYFEK